MSKEQEKNVQTAAAQKENSGENSGVAVETPAAVPVLIEVPTLSESQIKMCKEFNIPIDKLFEGLGRINLFFQDYVQFREQVGKGFEGLKPLADLSSQIAERQKQAAAQPQPPPIPQGAGGVDLSAILPYLQPVLGALGMGGGASSNPLMEKAAKFIDAQIEAAMNPQPNAFERLGEALVNNIVAKVGSKTAENIAAGIG